jgi:hypothetical protein
MPLKPSSSTVAYDAFRGPSHLHVRPERAKVLHLPNRYWLASRPLPERIPSRGLCDVGDFLTLNPDHSQQETIGRRGPYRQASPRRPGTAVGALPWFDWNALLLDVQRVPNQGNAQSARALTTPKSARS